MTEPLKVEVLNSASWWLPWLPVLGSLLVAVAAVIGVVINNRTNRDAIDAANERANDDRSDAERRANEDRTAAEKRATDDRVEAARQADERGKEDRVRDFRTWKRDRILEIATDVAESAIGAEDEYRRIASSHEIDANSVASFSRVADLTQRCEHAAAKLSIIGEHDLAELARALRVAANDEELVLAVHRMNFIHRERRRYEGESDGDRARLGDERDALAPSLEHLLRQVNEARAYFQAAAESALRSTTHPAVELDLAPLPIVPRA
ncbi:hypothetical protein SAMN04489765_3115 [Tsukamurella pulmonis]|uniref:Uncharacterized protein n=1 Tax=Tsukamurella pulmonis TaxID=47312 RepID=A0A1H1G535_9ACTN|nr:hypothetical protein [Tsukamurella pulmonis]SDR08301.1 hypothetical protein SAMN04489765_3115 [Tsukamurella pulmonis]SUP17860.1 Uncharacterised protein [Tsukamurella pulmonis]